jgi:hypothetical protein
MKLKNLKRYDNEAHHTGGAAQHGIHHRHAGKAPVFVVSTKRRVSG